MAQALFVMVTLSDSTVRRVTTGRKALWLAPEFGILVCEPRMTRGHSKVSGFALKVWPGGRRCVGKYAVAGRILWIRWALRDRILVGGGLG
jgi:hypothetical protein